MGAAFTCCCRHSEEEAFPRSEGAKTQRTITDTPFCVIFWVWVALMVAVSMDGWFNGNYKRLTHGVDWDGRICGNPNGDPAMAEVAGKPFMMFCGSPDRENGFPKYIIQGSTACVPECPTAGTKMTIDCLMPAYHNFTTYKGGKVQLTNGVSIENTETLEMTLTQSVTTQNAYATELYGGRFCLPSRANTPLRDLIINGPWGKTYRPLVTFGSLKDAYPLFLISAGVAVLLGTLYMCFLGSCAGLLIFISMVMTTLFTLAAGVFFFLAVLMDMDDTSTDYAKFNPIMSVYVGPEAKVYSVVTGIILLLASVILGVVGSTSVSHIDECIGLIAASNECLQAGFALRIWPLMQAAVFGAIFIIFWFIGLPVVVSLGSLDYSMISINGEGVDGLNRVWKRDWLQHKEIIFYVIGIAFMLELYIQLGHYIVSYVVCCWFFKPGGKDVAVNNNRMVQKAIGEGSAKKVEVRVAGVDPNYGPRQGSVVMTSAGKMLVVPVGKKGPGLGRLDMEESKFEKGDVPCMAFPNGLITGILFHIGTLTIACPIIFVLRPFRLFAKCVSHLLKKTKEPEKHWSEHQAHHRPPNDPIRHGLSLFTQCLEQIFGCFSKDALTEVVLAGDQGFMPCALNSFKFLTKAGGSISHLHGTMMMYEIFGCLFITLFCTWTSLIIQDKVDWFNDPANSHYIEDKNASAIACGIIGFAISFAYMSTWSQIADTLLYCVAWNRKQEHEGHSNHEQKPILSVDRYCPQQLRYLLPTHEREAGHEHGLHSHGGMGHAMQIMATMEHGAMNSMSGVGGIGGTAMH